MKPRGIHNTFDGLGTIRKFGGGTPHRSPMVALQPFVNFTSLKDIILYVLYINAILTRFVEINI